jgi:virginiamycin A acetyltransferase
VVGNDAWFGYRTMVMPGIRIGHSAIVASGAVVVDDVPDYGSSAATRPESSAPATASRTSPAFSRWLGGIGPPTTLTKHLRTIMSGSIDDFEAIVPA